MIEKNKFNSLDICKFLMAICVVAIHTRPMELCDVTIINEIYNSFVSMAVPFFFLSSGFLLAQKFELPFFGRENIKVVKKHLFKILKMYLLWTVIYLPMAIYYFITSEMSLLKSVFMYIRGFVLIGTQYNSWHLWYLLSTIYALIFLLILLYFKVSTKKVIIFSFFIFIISIGVNFLTIHTADPNTFMGFCSKMIKISIDSGRIFTGLFYLPFGCVLAQKRPNLVGSLSMFVVGYLLNVFVKNSNWDSSFLAISSIGFFCFISTLSLPDSWIYSVFRKMSTIIYFVHMYIWTLYYTLIYGEKTSGLDCFIATVIICLMVSLVSILVMECSDKKKKVFRNDIVNNDIN